MFETIVVPLDGSKLAEAALPLALGIKEKFGSKLVLVRAVEPLATRLAQVPALDPSGVSVTSVELMEEAVEAEEMDAEAYLEHVRTNLGAQDIDVELIEGGAVDAIIKVATDRNAQLIVMSSHGRGGLGRLVFGSVTDALLRHSHIPVLLSRSTEST